MGQRKVSAQLTALAAARTCIAVDSRKERRKADPSASAAHVMERSVRGDSAAQMVTLTSTCMKLAARIQAQKTNWMTGDRSVFVPPVALPTAQSPSPLGLRRRRWRRALSMQKVRRTSPPSHAILKHGTNAATQTGGGESRHDSR